MRSTHHLILGSLAVLAILILLLWWSPGQRNSGGPSGPLLVWCASGVQAPVEAAVRAFEKECGGIVQLQYGGSGTLLANIQVSGRGDLFIAADEGYLATARSKGLVEEVVPLGLMSPVIAVRKGNPTGIRSVDDLPAGRISLAQPGAAAIGDVVRTLLLKDGRWEALEKKVRVFKTTVMDVAMDVRLGAVDAGIVWDATVAQDPALEAVRDPVLGPGQQKIAIGVLRSAARPAAALRLARWLGAPDKGLPEFARRGYGVVDGDAWAETPEVVFFSGGVNRLAVEDTVRRFEEREGARVTRVYNGCGILVSQMKAGQRPDAYLACDVSYLRAVADLFLEGLEVSETDIVILAAKGNPLAIRGLEDLGRPGLRLGTANPQQSTLGDLTEKLLGKLGLLERIRPNIRIQTPTADLLVNELRTGALDAAVVYRANTSQVKDDLAIVGIDDPGAKAVQPYAVRKGSVHRLLMERLRSAILTEDSRRKYESLGFRFLAGGTKP